MKNKNTLAFPEKVYNYLKKYQTGSWSLEVPYYNGINVVITIPALAECENIKKLLESFLLNDTELFSTTLIIFVVNNLVSASDEIKYDNLKTINFFREVNSGFAADDMLIKRIRAAGLKIGFVDAATEGKELPEKEGGVGLARKIGMDLSLSVFDYNLRSNRLLVCLDSDCTVPANYLTEINKLTSDNKFSAGAVNYIHPVDETETAEAIICYEIFLRYYVLGLKLANSPYAFHSIGSTILCNAEAYIKAEGMNKKKAAEDFYFLEKLSKIYEIKCINTTCVYPSARVSYRVPFGTGQRVDRFLKQVQDEYLLYSLQSFMVLKEWLNIFNDAQMKQAEEYLNDAKNIDDALYDFLCLNNFKEEWTKILNNSKQPQQIQKQKSIWFDGFRTLKLIHYLRDNKYAPEPMFDVLDKLFAALNISIGIERISQIPDVNTQLEYLKILRKM